MGGIINYYHGESGVIVDRQYVATEQQKVHVLSLQGNPHREFAYDYEGGDVHMDPLLGPGDKVFFVRTDFSGGIWVGEGDRLYPRLQQAINRATNEIRARANPPASWMSLIISGWVIESRSLFPPSSTG